MLRLFVRRYSISEDLTMFDITKVNAVAFAGRSDAEIAAEIGIRLAVLDDYNDYREKHCPSLTFIQTLVILVTTLLCRQNSQLTS
jgi:hypothetical protein